MGSSGELADDRLADADHSLTDLLQISFVEGENLVGEEVAFVAQQVHALAERGPQVAAGHQVTQTGDVVQVLGSLLKVAFGSSGEQSLGVVGGNRQHAVQALVQAPLVGNVKGSSKHFLVCGTAKAL